LPNNREGNNIGGQLFRSGTSVGAHYREAFRAKSNADFISKCEGALQELDETAYWFELIEESGLMSNVPVTELRKECDELTAIFVAMTTNIKRRTTRA
jgi:four helix bundle protein